MTEENNFASASEYLQEAEITIIDTAECNSNSSYNGTIQSSMLCAGVMDGGIDSCQGRKTSFWRQNWVSQNYLFNFETKNKTAQNFEKLKKKSEVLFEFISKFLSEFNNWS